ncbi:NAD(P)H-quinone oxidoreductase subunit 5 [Geodermatophilus saharensis]|uniref:NAD(P)H-quinone oxidoreductase subunit 5 n=1 Tax=Geodermatophilus saharensis TaxID=1137994 RepID=A0A239AG89_9ACTN|nr:proton-conducting transporter membrane subunit [Geodermatophilus saharensis]SNR94655.1 NAD(P)H-quinone oxidoreductase subunit 5 [Geodermatophilus saharensis]
MHWLLLTAVLAPVGAAAAGVLAEILTGGRPGPASRALAVGAGVALAAAVGLAAAVAAAGPVAVGLPGSALPVLEADRLGVVLLLLVTGVGTVVAAFARRYLQGDPAATRHALGAGLLLSASAALATAATLVSLAAAWSGAGLALCLLLGCARGVAGTRSAVVRTAATTAVGDLALWTAVGVLVLDGGDRRLTDLAPAAAGLGTGAGAAVACLLVVAALARSAQLPLGRWLPATVAAPTPVSALLHAGVVNAGGVLMVRTAPVVGASGWATHLALAAGATTAVVMTLAMLARPDVKGALAASTAGQMGLMVAACALGWWAAAVVHLVAHGAFKATLFLASGSAVQAAGRAAAAPRPVRAAPAGTPLVAAALAAGATALAVAVVPGHASGASGVVLAVLAWATGAALARGWLRRVPTPRGVAAAAAALLALVPAHLLVTTSVAAFLAPALPAAPAAAPSALLLLVPAAAAVLLTAVLSGRVPARLRSWQVPLHARALAAGSPSPSPVRTAARRRSPGRPPVLVPAPPVPSSLGARP